MAKIYRTLRVIEYTGTLEFINSQKTLDVIKGTKLFTNGNSISSSYIGEPIEVKSFPDENITKEPIT